MTRVGWLRAAVLGPNDGIVSTASLIVGVAAASSGRPEVLVAGVAGLVAHARDELGISDITTARPVQAALTSAATFTAGAAVPLLLAAVSPLGALPAGIGRLVGAAVLG